MGDGDVFVVNCTILSDGAHSIADIRDSDADYNDEYDDADDLICEFFMIFARGDQEWYIRPDRDEIESSDHPVAKEILAGMKSLADHRAKNAGDEETEKRIREETWELTYVW